MENNEVIKYEVGLIKRVSNAISVTNKLLALAEPQLIPYRKKDKWGFCTPDKKIVIDCIYKWAYPFSEGMAKVNLDSDYEEGFIDKTGKVIIPIEFSLGYTGNFKEGMARIYFSKINEQGFIDKTGKVVIPCKYESVHDFSEGLALVKYNDKYGFIDKTGKEVIACMYDGARDFSEGLAMVRLDDKEFFINKFGKLPFLNTYDHATSFSEGLAVIEYNNKYGFIDKSGSIVQYISENIRRKLLCDFSEGMLCVGSSNYNEGGYGFINKKGKIVIPFKYDYAENFSEGLASVKYNNKYGFIDKSGIEVIHCLYDTVEEFKNGFSKVALNGKSQGYIDKKGMEYWED